MRGETAARLVESVASQDGTIEILHDALDSMPVSVALLVPVQDSQDFQYVYANPLNRALKPRASIVGRTYGDVWPELADFVLPHFREVFETGIAWGAEDAPLQVEIEPGKIETRFYTFQVSLLEAAGERILLDRSLETTAQVKSLEALRESEERFHGLVAATSDVLYRMNADWSEMRQLTSAGFLAYTEKPDSEWLQKYIHPDDQEHVLAVINEAVKSKGTFSLEHRVLRADGTIGWTYSRAVPVVSDTGEIIEWFGAADDITKRREAEDALDQERRRAVAQTERMALLKELAEIGASSAEVDQTVARLVDALMRALESRAAYIWGIDETLAALVPVGATDPQAVSASHGPTDLEAQTISARAVRERAAVFIEDMDTDPLASEHTISFARELGFRSAVALPLVINDVPVGALALGWPDARSFGAEELSYLESVAAEVAVGLHNARLFEAERSARQRTSQELDATSLLLEAAESLAAAVEVKDALELVGALARSVTGAKRAFVNLINAEERMLEPVVPASRLSAPRGGRLSFDVLSGTALNAIVERRTKILDYEAPGIPDYDRSIAQKNECRLALFVPLLLRGTIVAHITLDDPGERHQFCPRDIRMVEGIASQAAIIVRNAQLFEDRARQADLAEALNRVNAAVHSTLDFDQIMNRVVVDATRAASLDMMAIHLLEGDRWRFAYSYNLPEDLRRLRLESSQAPLSSAVLEHHEAIVIKDARTDERANRQLMSRFDIGALMALPLYVRGDAIGVLFAGCFGEETTLDGRQIDFMHKVASTLSLALENARLYQTEHEIADKLQTAILALPNVVRGIEFSHAYHSAAEVARVGGDFYDLFQIDDDHVGLVIGDVAGKGLQAAVLTSMVKNTVRAHAHEGNKSPARVMELTNSIVFRSTASEAFVTLFYAVLDCRDGSLVYANAGHTTAAVAGPHAPPRGLAVTGPILGAFQHATFDQACSNLAMEEVLLLYTDGVTEARSGEELYGEQRLFELLARQRGGDTRALVAALVSDVMMFSDQVLRDDVAILAVKRVERGTDTPLQRKLEVG